MTVETDLAAYVDAVGAPHFAWGRHDCARFVAGWMTRRTGIDPGEGYAYASEDDARMIVSAAGSLEALAARLAARVGWEQVPGYRTGDVAVVRFLRGNLFGIVAGRHVLAATDGGIARIIRASIVRAFGPGGREPIAPSACAGTVSDPNG